MPEVRLDPMTVKVSGSDVMLTGNRRQAFTLIEMLVVVAIIALLVSILLPSLTNAREQARVMVCKTRIRELVMGHSFYGADNAGAFPHWSWWLYDGVGHKEPKVSYYPQASVYKISGGTRAVDSSTWVKYGDIYKYVKNPETYFCPVDDRQRWGAAIGAGKTNQGNQAIHSYVRFVDVNDSYHQRLGGIPQDCINDGPNKSDFLNPDLLRPRSLKHNAFNIVKDFTSIPSRVVLLFEEHQGNPNDAGDDSLNDGHSGLFFGNKISGRHRKRAHVGYYDGRAELVDSVRWNSYSGDLYAVHKAFGGGAPPPKPAGMGTP